MTKFFELQNNRMKWLSLFSLALISTNVVSGQFGTTAPTSTTSAAPLTINGVYISRGFYQANSNSYTSIGIGTNSLGATTLNAYNNTAVGVNALSQSYDAVACVALGNGALRYANGSDNTALGANALGAVSNTGIQNVAVGGGSLGNNTGGNYNTAVGVNSLVTSQGGYANVAIGHAALYSNNASAYNTAVGYQSLKTLGVGGANTTIGSHALWTFTSGNYNTAVGCSTMVYKTTGDNNTVMGHAAYGSAGSGSNNCAFGYGSLGIGAGNFNVAIGSGATVSSGVDYQLSIQNVIYGSTMSSGTNGRLRIGSAPVAAVAGVLPAGVIAKLRIDGISGTTIAAVPSLQLDFVPINGGASPTPNPTGRYLFVDAAGVVAQAPIPANGVTTNTLTNPINTITSTVNGVIASAPAVNTVVNTISGLNALTTTVNGVASTPVTLYNLYSTNGIINGASTTGVNREVDMNDRNIWFKTTNSPTNGRIYIGSNATPTMFPIATGAYRLYVEGGILTEKIKVAVRASANWADYVFADDYKLMPLQKVEAFIKTNKHLPGVESAEELTKVGLDLGEMQAKQMSKVEELTLYIIEQNKTLEKQNAEIEILKAQVKILLGKSK
jgi:trimeric autotransporter adhesin